MHPDGLIKTALLKKEQKNSFSLSETIKSTRSNGRKVPKHNIAVSSLLVL